MPDINTISGIIVDAAFQLHKAVGPGLHEKFYEVVLARDLRTRGLHVERQRWISFNYQGLHFRNICRVDLVVEELILVEIKSRAAILIGHRKQLHTYLRIVDFRLGLLLNFGAPYMKDGIVRIANGL